MIEGLSQNSQIIGQVNQSELINKGTKTVAVKLKEENFAKNRLTTDLRFRT